MRRCASDKKCRVSIQPQNVPKLVRLKRRTFGPHKRICTFTALRKLRSEPDVIQILLTYLLAFYSNPQLDLGVGNGDSEMEEKVENERRRRKRREGKAKFSHNDI